MSMSEDEFFAALKAIRQFKPARRPSSIVTSRAVIERGAAAGREAFEAANRERGRRARLGWWRVVARHRSLKREVALLRESRSLRETFGP